MLDRLYSSPTSLDRSKLCVVPGKYVKVLYVDVEVRPLIFPRLVEGVMELF